jgi:amino acid permease
LNLTKVFAIVLVVLVFVCLGGEIFLDYHYIHTRPEKPDPESGRVVYFNVHGSVVYLTQQENLRFQVLFWGKMVFIVAVFIYHVVFKPFGGDGGG